MKLSTPFIQLPVCFDVERLQAEVTYLKQRVITLRAGFNNQTAEVSRLTKELSAQQTVSTEET